MSARREEKLACKHNSRALMSRKEMICSRCVSSSDGERARKEEEEEEGEGERHQLKKIVDPSRVRVQRE